MAAITSTSALSVLVDLIASQAKVFESAYLDKGQHIPSLDDTSSSDPLHVDPAVDNARRIIIAAADQLISLIRPPSETLQLHAMGLFSTLALGIIEDANVQEILAEADPSGLHVNEIAAQNSLTPDMNARLLRHLATRHIFKEVAPNVFKCNRLSAALSKNKTMTELRADPMRRYENKAGIAAYIAHITNDALICAPHVPAFVKHPGESLSPFHIAHQTSLNLWQWYEQPGREEESRRLVQLMENAALWCPPDVVRDSVIGASLHAGSVIVDVGGGSGSAMMILYKEYPHLRYIIQDLEAPGRAVAEAWQSKFPEAYGSEQVTFQVHDFFQPQQVKNAAVYFMRTILHDWTDVYCIKILQHLRNAAGPDTKLVVVDTLVTPTCCDINAHNPTPAPLLGNLGIAGAGFLTAFDLSMLTMLNGKERTENDMRELGAQTGWKLQSVRPGHPMASFMFSVM